MPQPITTMMQEDDDDKVYIHNHLRFTILYHRDIETDLSRIVGFEVEPFSVQHKVSMGLVCGRPRTLSQVRG